MDSFEWNKIIGAVLGTLLFVMGVGFIAEAIYHPIEDRGVGYALPGEEEGHGGEPVEEEPELPLPVLLANADAGAGERQFAKCQSCHDPAEGGANKVGPALWDIVGRDMAGHEGFSYSTAMVEHTNDYPTWTYEALDEFLASPRDSVPGTKMSFAGLSDPEDRADMLAYLQTLSNDPVAFPEPEAAPTEEETVTDETAADDGAETMPSETSEEMAEESSEAQGEEMATEEEAEPAPADVVTESPTSTEPTEGDAVSDEVDAAGEAAESPAAEEPAAADDATMTEEAPAEDAAATDEGAAAEEPAMEESGVADDAAMTEEPAAEASGLAAQVASADVAVGQRQFAKCQACHDPSQGGANRVGPPLWDVVGSEVASRDYNYSGGMNDYAAEQSTWTLEALDAYLLAPRDLVPGTKMAFAGLRKDEDRHAVLAYLHSLSENPAPLE